MIEAIISIFDNESKLWMLEENTLRIDLTDSAEIKAAFYQKRKGKIQKAAFV